MRNTNQTSTTMNEKILQAVNTISNFEKSVSLVDAESLNFQEYKTAWNFVDSLPRSLRWEAVEMIETLTN